MVSWNSYSEDRLNEILINRRTLITLDSINELRYY
jgi:hypothetical protein